MTRKKPIRKRRKKDKQPKKQKLFTIVGIGASAGGLEAFGRLLKDIPVNSGMAYVCVQHLAPKHESMLDTLLARSTSVPVTVAANKMKIKPDNVYVIPPGKYMSLKGNEIRLVKASGGKKVHNPIDCFLSSLAKEKGASSIGVILSGTASDGVNGIRDIKAADGITFSQDEESSRYSGMPRSAIATGCIDFIASPEKIAKELKKISRHPFFKYPESVKAEEVFPEKADALKKIFFILRVKTGIDFSYYKHSTIKRRIRRRMVMKKISSLDKYINLLRKDETEVKDLVEDILIRVTSFFRDPGLYKEFIKKVFPEIMKKKQPGMPIRIWVPGCSTGEEVYSILIEFLEFLGKNASGISLQVFGTDISDTAIDKARRGIYPADLKTVISEQRLKRFFTKVEGGYRINKSLREMCIFAKHNIVSDPPFSNMDLVSCRNVLIYLGSVLQKRVLNMFHYALKKSGFLVLGTSESIGRFSRLFGRVNKKYKIYFKKDVITKLEYEYMPTYYRQEVEIKPEEKSGKSFEISSLFDVVNHVLLDRYVPTAVFVDSDMNIIEFWGHSGDYLEHPQGKANLNLVKMLNRNISLEIQSAVFQAGKRKRSVKKENIRFKKSGKQKLINIEVIPIRTQSSRECRFLIIFEEAGAVEPGKDKLPKVATTRTREKTVQSVKIIELKEELEKTKEYLQSVIETQETTNEELKSSLEELQSANEELQSTNEELETAKEELQSTNEELVTVNEELTNRNDELDLLNNDMTNLLTSVRIPIIMLQRNLNIRRFNPVAGKLFNLVPQDKGRKITDIRAKIAIPNFKRLIEKVLDDLKPREVELTDRRGHWYRVQVRPYITLDRRIEGVVLAVVDINMIKTALDVAEKAQSYSENILRTIKEPLLVVNCDHKIQMSNKHFCETFKCKKQEITGRALSGVIGRSVYTSKIKDVLKKVCSKGVQIDDHEVKIKAGKSDRIFLVNIRRVETRKKKPLSLMLMAFEDITERRENEKLVGSLSKFPSENPNPVLRISKQGKVLYANKTGKKVLNKWKKGIGKVVPKKWKDIVSESFRKGHSFVALDEQVVGEKTYSFNVAPVKEGQYANLYGRDITEAKEADKKIMEARDYWVSTFDSMSEAICLVDLKRNIKICNKSMGKLVGKKPDAIIGQKCCELVHGSGTIIAGCPVEKMKKTCKREEYNLEVGDKWFRVIADPVFDEKGKVVAAVHIVVDITTQKENEATLSESEKRYKALFENAGEGILVADAKEKKFLFANSAMCKLLGYTEREILRLGVKDIHPTKDLAHVVSEFKKQVRGDRLIAKDIPCLKKNGDVVYCDIRAKRVLIDGRECSLGLFSDITERKKSIEESDFRHKELLSIFDGMDDLVYIADPKTHELLYFNKAFRKRWKAKRGDKCYSVLQGLNAPCCFCSNKYIFGKNLGKTYIWESQNKVNKRWYHCINKAIRWPDGRMVRCEIAIDTTESRRAKENLIKEKERAQKYLDIAGVMIVAMDKEGRVALINKKGCQILGYKEKEIVGKNWFNNFLPKRIRKEIKTVSEDILKGKKNAVEYYENPIITKKGKERIIEWHNVLLRDDEGNITGHLSSGEDVTERRNWEDSLSESESRYRGIFESVDAAVYIFDMNGVIREVNPAACRLHNYTRKELIGLKGEKIVAAESKELHRSSIKSIAAGERFRSHAKMIKKDGAVIDVDVIGVPFKLKGEPHVLGVVRDITAQKKVEAMKDTLIRDVSHSLQTPLSMAKMAFSEFEKSYKRKNWERVRKFEEILKHSIDRSYTDISNILRAYALEKETLGKMEKISLKSAIKEIRKTVDPIAKIKNITLKEYIPDNAGKIYANKKEMKILLLNVIDNAMKFTGKGTIMIRSKKEKNFISITVKDTGSGISKDEQNKVFSKFYQRHPAVEGVGLGLSICTEIMDRHNGEINVSSRGKNKGTTVTMRFPC